MHFYPALPHKALLSEARVYNRPHLLAGALHQLDRLTERDDVNLQKARQAGPGSVVDLLELKAKRRIRIELVMPGAAVPMKGKISVLSLLGSHLLGLRKGDTCRINLWGGSYSFQILDIFQL